MAHKSLVPKQRSLTETENQSTFESWRESMLFHISLDSKSARFLSDLKTWTSDTENNRGFTDDSNDRPADTRMTKEAKCALLNIILGSISTYAPVISPRFIKCQATSLGAIWDRLRGFYGFRKTGARILDLPQLQLHQNESREALWERLITFTEEILLTTDCGVKHEGAPVTKNEIFTPTIHNMLVAIWLHTINPALPSLIQQRFSTELRNNTVFSIRDEISDCIPILLAEMQDREGLINRAPSNYQNQRYRNNRNKYQAPPSTNPRRNCCRQAIIQSFFIYLSVSTC